MSHHGKSADQLMVGTYLVKLVGLKEALKESAGSGLSGREAIVDSLLAALSGENYIPPARESLYRTAVWREYLRLTGEDFSPLYSEMPVTVQAEAGRERDRFVELLESIFAEFELKPVVNLANAPGTGPSPCLVINDETVAEGPLLREELKAAVSRSISEW